MYRNVEIGRDLSSAIYNLLSTKTLADQQRAAAARQEVEDRRRREREDFAAKVEQLKLDQLIAQIMRESAANTSINDVTSSTGLPPVVNDPSLDLKAKLESTFGAPQAPVSTPIPQGQVAPPPPPPPSGPPVDLASQLPKPIVDLIRMGEPNATEVPASPQPAVDDLVMRGAPPPLEPVTPPGPSAPPEVQLLEEQVATEVPQKEELPKGLPDARRTEPPRELSLTLPDGRVIPLAPLKYREEVREEERQKKREDVLDSQAIVPEVPNDPELFGAYAGQKNVPMSTLNVLIAAMGRRDQIEVQRLLREKMDEEKLNATIAKKEQLQAEAESYVEGFRKGDGVIGDVPMSHRALVQMIARQRGVKVPTRKLGEPMVEKLDDMINMIERTKNLDELESGFSWKMQAALVPDVVTQYTKIGARAKSIQPEYFLYTSETLKAIQGTRPSDYDMKIYMENMPKIGDPPEVKKYKVARLREQLIQRYNRRLKSLQGLGFNIGVYELVPDTTATGTTTATGGEGISPEEEALLKKYKE